MSTEGDIHPEFMFPLRVQGDESAVPAEFRPLYRKDPEDGSLRLLSTLAKQIEAPGLKTALQKSRQDARDVERREKEKHKRTLQLLGVESADDVASKIEELRRASSGAADAARAEVENRIAATYGAQLKQQKAEAEKLRKSLHETLIDGEAAKAIAAAKGSVRALMPHVKNSMKLIEEDGILRPRVVDDEGHVRYGNDGRPLGVADLVSELKSDSDFAMNFESSGSSGSGARGASGSGGGGGGKATKAFSKKEWLLAMSKAKPDERAQMMRDASSGRITVKD